jgi:predicted nucleic acid-binding protein
MQRLVVDAGTVLSWFDADGAGAEMRRQYAAGGFAAVAPSRLHGDILAELTRRSDLPPDRLASVAAELPRAGIELHEPPLSLLAGWLARGIEPEVAPYAALAESLDLRLVTTDPRLLRGASSLVRV